MTLEDQRRAIVIIEELLEEVKVAERETETHRAFRKELISMTDDFMREITDEAY